MVSTSTTTTPAFATQADFEALQGDMDIFWLMFGAILVFCELLGLVSNNRVRWKTATAAAAAAAV